MTNANANGATEKTLDKIRKLLAVGNDDRGNETERETAMRQALKLLAKHNLEMKDVQDLDNKEDREEYHYEEFPDPFRKVIGTAIAELFFCKFYPTKVPGKQKLYFHFVGLESNAQTALEVCKFVIRSICVESGKQQAKHTGNHGWGTTFRNGAGSRIAQRCTEMRAEEEKEQEVESTGTALVLASLYDQEAEANLDFALKVLEVKLVTKTVKLKSKSLTATQAGKQFADSVPLAAPAKQIT